MKSMGSVVTEGARHMLVGDLRDCRQSQQNCEIGLCEIIPDTFVCHIAALAFCSLQCGRTWRCHMLLVPSPC